MTLYCFRYYHGLKNCMTHRALYQTQLVNSRLVEGQGSFKNIMDAVYFLSPVVAPCTVDTVFVENFPTLKAEHRLPVLQMPLQKYGQTNQSLKSFFQVVILFW
jgi:hypothetical protein